MSRSVHFHLGPNGTLLVDRPDSTRESHIEIADVPDDVSIHAVRRHLGHLAMWPWPRRLSWGAIAALPAGRLLRRSELVTLGAEI